MVGMASAPQTTSVNNFWGSLNQFWSVWSASSTLMWDGEGIDLMVRPIADRIPPILHVVPWSTHLLHYSFGLVEGYRDRFGLNPCCGLLSTCNSTVHTKENSKDKDLGVQQ